MACLGLNLASGIVSFLGALIAIYAVGKTVNWRSRWRPNLFQQRCCSNAAYGRHWDDICRSDRNARIGLRQGRFAGQAIRDSDSALYYQYWASTPSRFLSLKMYGGLDGKMLTDARSQLEKTRIRPVAEGERDQPGTNTQLSGDFRAVYEASMLGCRKAPKVDAIVPE